MKYTIKYIIQFLRGICDKKYLLNKAGKVQVLMVAIAFFAAGTLMAQQTITGNVQNENQEPLVGVTVYLKGTTQGTITDINGNYKIQVPEGDNTMVFSFVGYNNEEIAVEGQSVIDVTLLPSVETLDEIIVVGYGVQKKSLVTGSIAKVDAKALSQTQDLRVEQALQGKTSGVTISQSSGQPGSEFTIRIRGTGSHESADPLFIVDGMRTGGIDFIDPNDIESIEILKDAASAAIYGAEAANGVVLITTKKGLQGKTQITYNAYYGFQTPSNVVEMMDAKQYATYYREALGYEIKHEMPGLSTTEVDNAINAVFPYSPDTLGKGTNWMDEIFNTAPMQKHYLTFSGGNERSTYFISTGYYTADGIVGEDKSNYQRFNTRINGDFKVNDWMKVGARIGYSRKLREDVGVNNEYGSLVSTAFNLDPITPVYMDSADLTLAEIKEYNRLPKDENGNIYGLSRIVKNEFKNPYSSIAEEHDIYTEDKLVAGIFADISPLKGLTYTTKLDVDMAYGQYNSWARNWYAHDNQNRQRSATVTDNNRWYTYQWDNYLKYNLTTELHNLNLLAGMSFREHVTINHRSQGDGLIDNSWDYARLDYIIGSNTHYNPSGYKDHSLMLSYFGRFDYSFKERYMVTSNLRYDGSNKFGEDNKFGLFPSFSGGWVVSRENFWNNVPVVNFMKVRASWGQNGSVSNLGDFDYVSTMDGRPTYVSGTGEIINGVTPSRVSNMALKWETSEQVDIGIDLGFFRNRITFTADYYEKNTKDLLADATTPYLIGAGAPKVNAANIKNSGYEFELGVKNSVGEFNYNIFANLSKLKNVVTNLDTTYIQEFVGTTVGPASGNITRFDEGYPVWYFTGFRATGIFQTQQEVYNYVGSTGDTLQPNALPGDVIFEDANGDGVINDDDRVYLGKPHPDWVFGLNINLEYKNFDFSCFMQGVQGVDVYNGIVRTDINFNNRPLYFYEDRWTGEGSTDEWFRPSSNADENGNMRPSNLFVEDGSYVRLKQLMLGYNLPTSLLSKVQIENLRVYVSGNNLMTFTKYHGMDPEIGFTRDKSSDPGGAARSIAVDRGFYPSAKQVIFGLNVTF